MFKAAGPRNNQGLEQAFKRLRGTTFQTDIRTATRWRRGFSASLTRVGYRFTGYSLCDRPIKIGDLTKSTSNVRLVLYGKLPY